MDALLEKAVARQVFGTKMRSVIKADNPAGIALYRKFGFEHEGTVPYYLYGGGRWAHVHVMSRWK